MRRAKLPLNPAAVEAANAAVASHTGGRALTTAPQDAAYRRMWFDAYLANGGEMEAPAPPGNVGQATQSCSPRSGVLTREQAQELFDKMASQPDIAFKYPADGCYARAHIMAKRMQAEGVEPGKAWTFASDPDTDRLWVTTDNDPRGEVTWGYHVAPTIKVQQPDCSVATMVVDPSLFSRPVSLEEWKDVQHDHPTLIETKLGEPPKPEYGGTGYWPGPDPTTWFGRSIIDEHAEAIMKEYKKEEGPFPKDKSGSR